VRSLENSLEANHADNSRSNSSADHYPVDLGAIFVSLELSKSTWLVTALSPGSEKMSRHTVAGGDIAGLFACFATLRQKATRRTNILYPLVVIQEAGLDGFWLGRVLSKEAWIESHIVEAASIAMPRGIAGRRLTVSTAKR
jgi:transposase